MDSSRADLGFSSLSRSGFHTEFAAEEAARMGHAKQTARKRKLKRPKTVLRLLDLEHSKSAVLNSLGAVSSQESYGHAIDEFINWYCSEPRLSFSRTVVLRYRIYLEQRNLAPSTINVRLAAVRRLAYEASDNGLLSPELAAGIRRVKGVKRLGVRIGNWLTLEQSRTLLKNASSDSLRGSCLITGLWITPGRGGRIENVRPSASGRSLGHCRLDWQGQAHSDCADAQWVKAATDEWIGAAKVTEGRIFRRINKNGNVWGDGITPKAVWHIVKTAAKLADLNVAPHDLRRTCARLCHVAGGELEQIQFLLGHLSVQTTERYLGCKQKLHHAVNDNTGLEISQQYDSQQP